MYLTNKINFKDIITILIKLFIVFTLFIPVSSLNKLMFIFIIIFYFTYICLNRKIIIISAPLMVFIIFTYSLLIAQFNGNIDKLLAKQFFLSVSILFLVIPMVHFKISIRNFIIRISIIYSIISIVLAYFTFNKMIMSTNLLTYLKDISLVAYGYRNFVGSDQFFFHFGTVPFLVLPLYLILFDRVRMIVKKTLFLILIIFTVYLSSSRALYLISLIILIYYILKIMPKHIRRISVIFIIMCSAIITVYLVRNTMIFSINEHSNSIKIGHFTSVIKQSNIRQFFLGDGLASRYFSEGANKIIAHTELTYMDLYRYFGAIFLLFLLIVLVFPTFKIRTSKLENTIFFVLYLVLSATNPTLINSYGFIIVVWYWNEILGEIE